MATQFTEREDLSQTRAEEPPFAPTPIYARDGKAKRRAVPRAFSTAAVEDRPFAAAPREERSFAPTQPESTVFEGDTGLEGMTFARPEREVRPGRSIPTAVVFAVPAAILLAGGAYFMMQPRDNGAETVAMSEAAPSALATAPAVTTPPPAPVDATPIDEPAPMARAQPEPSARREAPTARARPAAPPAATESGVNASATLPANPLPYTAVAPQPVNPAPTAVNPPVVVAEPVNPAPTAPSTPAPDLSAPEASTSPTPEAQPSAVTP